MSISKSSAFHGNIATHVKRRDDAVIHHGREYVPTQKETIYISNMEELTKFGGIITFNEDQTEIWFTLPERHKFSIQMFKEAPEVEKEIKRLKDVLFQRDTRIENLEHNHRISVKSAIERESQLTVCKVRNAKLIRAMEEAATSMRCTESTFMHEEEEKIRVVLAEVKG